MMLRISNLLGESILFFISLSIFSLLSFTLFVPMANIGYQSYMEEYLDGYSYGYSVSYLFNDGDFIYLYNGGRDIYRISKIYMDGLEVQHYIEVFDGSSWIGSSKVPSQAVFRFNITYLPSQIDLVIEDRYILHVEVIP